MAAVRVMSLSARCMVILDRLVGVWWLFLVFCLLPVFLLVFEPAGLAREALFSLGGATEEGLVVESEMMNISINSESVWRVEVALSRDPSQRSVGYSTGLLHPLDRTVGVQCSVLGCDDFRIMGLRSTRMGTGLNLGLMLVMAFLSMFPLRTAWRRRAWIAALQRGTRTRGWVGEESSSDEDVQRLTIHYDDAMDARWFVRSWLGYRQTWYSESDLQVLYLEESPRKAVVLAALPDWMGRTIPEPGEAWPRPDLSGWLRVISGLAVVLGPVLFIWLVV